MTQVIKKLKPLAVVTDVAPAYLKEYEASFLKGYDINVNKNGSGEEGGNYGKGKKLPSNYQTISIPMPEGDNQTIGFFEAKELNEAYVFNWNSLANHSIYRLDALSMTCELVCRMPELNFSLDPKHAISKKSRVTLQVVYDVDDTGNKRVKEKYLIFTDGNNWQRWIGVIASTKTNSFNADAFPYFKLQPPHFDRDELIDYPTRPPVYAPIVTEVSPTPGDYLKDNELLRKSIQFAFRYIMTDGRPSAISWYSTPYFSATSSCDVNNDSIPREIDLEMYAGSPLVEKIQLLVRYNGNAGDGARINTDWALYDTIEKFKTIGDNEPSLIGNDYWKRTNSWDGLNYNSNTNTIKYRYSGDKGTTAFDQNDADMVQNDVPLKSYAITRAGDVLMWGNNLYFYPNLPQSTLDEIKIEVVEEDVDGACTLPTRKIKLYLFSEGFVWNKGKDTDCYFSIAKTLVGDKKYDFDEAYNEAQEFGLNLGTKEGFIVYLAGTPYFAISRQFRIKKNGTEPRFVGPIDSTNAATVDTLDDYEPNNDMFVHICELSVPAGRYVARFARHDAVSTDDFERKSTYISGIEDIQNQGSTKNGGKELVIDVTNSDYDMAQGAAGGLRYFYLVTPRRLKGVGIGDFDYRMIEGYVYEDNINNIGVDFISYYIQKGSSANSSGIYTDHNGFFFGFSLGGSPKESQIRFDAKLNCEGYVTNRFGTAVSNGNGYFPDQNIFLKDIGYNFGSYALLSGRVLDCKSGKGIAGLAVTLQGVRTNYTDSDGNYSIRVNSLSNKPRTGYLVFNSNGVCLLTDCNCGPVSGLIFTDGAAPPCQTTTERSYPTVADFLVRQSAASGRGPKGGGRYPVTINCMDLTGRKVYPGLIGYADIPTFLEKGTFTPSRIRLAIGTLNLPDYVKWVTFGVGQNTRTNKFIQWVGDKIEFFDVKGELVPDGSGAVRAKVTIQSLYDFNYRENFATTANYQFLKGDRCRIYDDGQGTMFDPATNSGFLDYQILGSDFNSTVDPAIVTTSGIDTSNITVTATTKVADPKSFYIEYDKRLLALRDKCGFWIELNRPKQEFENEVLYGVSGTYPVIDGEITEKEILLDFFDTFYQNRNVIVTNCSGNTFNHPFESQAVTDYWGDGVFSSGLPLFRDPEAQQRWYTTDSIKTDAFVNQGRVNGLGICRTENRHNFKDQDWGGIVSMHAERNVISIICENDYFIVDYNMNYAKVDSSGRIVATLDNTIGQPYQKIGDNFGCALEDVASIEPFDGMITWADRKNSAVILMTPSGAVDISQFGNKGWFINKFKHLQSVNEQLADNDYDNLMQVLVGVKKQQGNNQIFFTFKQRSTGKRCVDYVNNEREIMISKSETFVYNIELKKWNFFAPFVPEFYGSLNAASSGVELISFAAGKSWFHDTIGKNGFMRFFGVRTNQVIEVVENFEQSKLKIFQSITIESGRQKYFIDKIVTDDHRVFSTLPLSYFNRKGNVQYGELLRNMNSYPDPNKLKLSMLVDGNSLAGNYASFRFISDPETIEEYCEVDNVLVRLIGSEKSAK